MAFTTLIAADVLARHLGDSSFAVIDCRFVLNDVSWGEQAYESGHIPGAVYAHLDHDLSGPKTGGNGRHPLPDPRALASTFGRLGIDRSVQVVAYDQNDGSFASRFWWLLRWLGHDQVAVLDGGFAKWALEGRPTKSGRELREPRVFSGVPRRELLVDTNQVEARIADPDWSLVDARAPERYRGDVEPIDKVAGHIPGSVNHPFKENLDESGAFLPPETLRARIRSAIGDVAPEHIICYCGSGVTACHNLLALEHAGLGGARLYPGSWSEWSSDPKRPVER